MSFVFAIFARRFRQQRAGADLLAFLDDDVRAGRNRVARAALPSSSPTITICGCRSSLCSMMTVPIRPVASSTSRLIVTPAIMSRNSILPAFLGKNRHVVRIPLHEGFALLHLGAVGLRNHRADHDIVAFELASFGIVHADRAVLVQHDPTAVERLHSAQIVELNVAIILRLDDRLLEGLARGSTDVECSHRQLRSGLADRLRGNNADRFAQLHELAGGQIASVAHRANAAAAFAGQDRTNL